MPTCFHFKQYLQKKSMDDPAQLMWNYLTRFYPDQNQNFTASILKDFFFWILHDLHYRSIHHSAAHFILDEVQPYCRKHHLHFEFDKLKSCLPPQITNINNKDNVLASLELWHTKNSSPQDSIQVLPFNNSYALVLKLKRDGRLEVFLHSSAFVIDEGCLRPLPPLSCLHYNSQNELDPLKTHYIHHPPRQCFLFRFQNLGMIELQRLNFPDCSLEKKTILKKIEDCEELFIHLKTIESHFIKPKSDPVYKKLIQSLQNCYQLLISNHPEAVRESTACLEKAQLALKNFYSNDRLLLLLFANIEYRLKLKSQKAFNILQSSKIGKDPFIQEVLQSSSK